MPNLTKRGVELKNLDDEGHGLARIAVLSAVDSDGDTYEKGAFGEQFVQILAAHNWSSVPLGKARVFERGDEALAELHLNLATAAGKEWHAALKFDLEGCCGGPGSESGAGSPAIQEWSYGFRVLDAGFEERDGSRVRVLKRLAVHEVSPVVKGAGVGTATLTMKQAALKPDRFKALTADLAEIAAAVKADASVLSAVGLKQLGDIHAGIGAVLDAATADERQAAAAAARFQAFKLRKHLPWGTP